MTARSGDASGLVPLVLRTLGAAALDRIADGGEHVPLLGAGKPLAVLIYLVFAPRRTASRERLVDLLWSNVEHERGRQTLRQTLSQLRSLIGDDALTAHDADVTLVCDIDVDALAFSSALREGRAGDAIDAYPGPFLPDVAFPGGDAFERWASLERQRFHDGFLLALESLTHARLEHGRPRDAEVLARRLREADPSSQSAWRLLVEILLSQGKLLEARMEANSMERFLIDEDRELEPSTRAVICRARQARETPASRDIEASADLVGREKEFAVLLGIWRDAVAGHATIAEVVAPVGLGKTRLLRDVHQRLRAGGIQALTVRALAVERALSLGLVTAVAQAVGQLRGAKGVSTATARTLVALAPILASVFSATPAMPSSGDEATRITTAALLDLFRSVSDEQPFALLIDDLHWSDETSRRVLAAVFDRLEQERLLVIVARRPSQLSLIGRADMTHVGLPALTRPQVAALLSSMASLSLLPGCAEIIEALHSGASGSPLMIFDALRLAQEEGLLKAEGAAWRCANVPALLELLQKGSAARRRLQQLSRASWRALCITAVAGCALPVSVLAEAAQLEHEAVDGIVTHLEYGRFVLCDQAGVEIAHDQLRETMLDVATPEECRDAHRHLGSALLAAPALTPARDQQTASHLIAGGIEEHLRPLYVRWLNTARARGDRRSDRELGIVLLGEYATPARVRRLLAGRPLTMRIAGSAHRHAATWLLVSVLALLGIAGYTLRPRPSRLVLVVAPLSGTAEVALVPTPQVEIRDQYSRLVAARSETVHVSIDSGFARLQGPTTVLTSGGRAEFPDVRLLDDTGMVVLQFAANGMAPVRVRVGGLAPTDLGLFLVRASVNGQILTPVARTVRVSPGDSLTGTAALRYNTRWAAASVMLGVMPTWGDRRTSFITLGPLVTPARGLIRHVAWSSVAPKQPGCYQLIFAFQSESNVGQVASATNWTVGRLRWFNGDDVVDWSSGQLATADSIGRVRSSYLRSVNGRVERGEHFVGATVLHVVVGGGEGATCVPEIKRIKRDQEGQRIKGVRVD